MLRKLILHKHNIVGTCLELYLEFITKCVCNCVCVCVYVRVDLMKHISNVCQDSLIDRYVIWLRNVFVVLFSGRYSERVLCSSM